MPRPQRGSRGDFIPLPKPSSGETQDNFINRCISIVRDEAETNEQAAAICHTQWRNKMNKNELLEAIRARQDHKATKFGYGIVTADRYVTTLQERIGLDACYKYASHGTTSFADIMEKASRTLVYSNPEMELDEHTTNASAFPDFMKGAGEGIELPKNALMVFRHKLTTTQKDRDGDVLHSEGMELDPKMLLLWQHIHTMPIGKLLFIANQDKSAVSVVSAIVDMNEVCHDAAVMMDNGMGRFSHGFRAIEFDKIKDANGNEVGGFDIRKAEIMEESLVSVPANIGAETEEILLSLVEGGKLTSGIMKDVGKSIRTERAVRVPVNIDLKVLMNGKELENENESGNREGTRGKTNQTNASEKANVNSPKDDGTKEARDAKVKIYSSLEGSFEWIRDDLQKQLQSILAKDENTWVYIEASFSDFVIVEVNSRDKLTKFFKAGWEMKEGKPLLTGTMEEVQISAVVLAKMRNLEGRKLGRVLSRSNENQIIEAVADIVEAGNTEITRPCKALLLSAYGGLNGVLRSLGEEGEAGENEITVKEAMGKVLIEAKPNELEKFGQAINTINETNKRARSAKRLRSLLR